MVFLSYSAIAVFIIVSTFDALSFSLGEVFGPPAESFNFMFLMNVGGQDLMDNFHLSTARHFRYDR